MAVGRFPGRGVVRNRPNTGRRDPQTACGVLQKAKWIEISRHVADRDRKGVWKSVELSIVSTAGGACKIEDARI
ncbi:MAG: hypothetical protein PWR21_2000 [Methanoculleus sp.]|jgi:hypothetical protein|nr:hypothetical protein [Methanoculleus sp.]